MKHFYFLTIILILITGCSSSKKIDKSPYECEMACIDANADYKRIQYPGCLCSRKGKN